MAARGKGAKWQSFAKGHVFPMANMGGGEDSPWTRGAGRLCHVQGAPLEFVATCATPWWRNKRTHDDMCNGWCPVGGGRLYMWMMCTCPKCRWKRMRPNQATVHLRILPLTGGGETSQFFLYLTLASNFGLL